MTEHQPDGPPPRGDDPPPPDTDRRLRAVEEAVASLAAEVRTRRLAVCDGNGQERIVAEVLAGQAQLRLSFVGPAVGPAPTAGAAVPPVPTTASVLVFACPPHEDLGPLAGVQVWADGDAVAAVEAWQDGTGAWRSAAHLTDGVDPRGG